MLRAALTISRKSPEKIKLGFKQIIRPLVKYGHVLAPAQRSALRLAAMRQLLKGVAKEGETMCGRQ